MIINEVRGLLDELDVTHAMLPVRLIFGVSEDEALALRDSIRQAGYVAHFQSSAYGDIEVVVTDGDVGSSQKKAP